MQSLRQTQRDFYMENKTELRSVSEGQAADTFNPVLLWLCADPKTQMLFHMVSCDSMKLSNITDLY